MSFLDFVDIEKNVKYWTYLGDRMLPTELGRIQCTSSVESCDKKVVCVESRSRLIYDL